MSELMDFMESIKSSPVPVGFGLLTLNHREDGDNVTLVHNPVFAYPLPVRFEGRPRVLMMVPIHLLAEVVSSVNAQPVDGMPFWYRYAIWSDDEAGR